MPKPGSRSYAGRRLHVSAVTQICLTLLLYIAPAAARAQVPETVTPPPEYKIEIVLFENLQANRRNEDSGPPPPPPEPIDPATQDMPEDEFGTGQSSPTTAPDEGMADNEPPETREPVSLLFQPAEAEDLTGIAGALRRRSGYRVLAHESWIQAGFPRSSAPAVDLETVGRLRLRVELPPNEDPPASDWRATSTLWVGRYLHLDMDAALKTGDRSVQLVESRRMRIGEMHYFDSPRIGAIAIVVRWEPTDMDSSAATRDEAL